MTVVSNSLKLVLLLLFMLAAPNVWAQGPPYQTDDPTPVDYKHFEAYIFGGVSGTPVAYGTLGPAFEFNWGAIPRVQLHVILPFGGSFPTNNPIYAPSGEGPQTFGLTDMEFGVKLAIIKQTKYCPQIGTFTMMEIPTGSFVRGLGEGKTWYKLPVWLEKDIGPWTLDGGMGYALVRQVDFRDFLYGGFLVKREITKKLDFGVEVFLTRAKDPLRRKRNLQLSLTAAATTTSNARAFNFFLRMDTLSQGKLKITHISASTILGAKTTRSQARPKQCCLASWPRRRFSVKMLPISLRLVRHRMGHYGVSLNHTVALARPAFE